MISRNHIFFIYYMNTHKHTHTHQHPNNNLIQNIYLQISKINRTHFDR